METLPNSIPRSGKIDHSISSHGLEWLYLYCASCGHDGGRVLKTDVPNREEFAFYLCNPCAEKYGNIPSTIMVPDEIFFAKVREAQLEHDGRLLDSQEVIEAVKDSDHYLSKLVNDRNTFLASE